jgi:hypothetical protein
MKRRAVYLREDQWELIDAILNVSASNLHEDVRLATKQLTRATVYWCVTRIAEIRDAIKIEEDGA